MYSYSCFKPSSTVFAVDAIFTSMGTSVLDLFVETMKSGCDLPPV